MPDQNAAVRKYLTEMIGTFVFMFAVIGIVLGGSECVVAATALGIGAVLMVMVYASGHISGGHLNPAVSIAAYLRGTALGRSRALHRRPVGRRARRIRSGFRTVARQILHRHPGSERCRLAGIPGRIGIHIRALLRSVAHGNQQRQCRQQLLRSGDRVHRHRRCGGGRRHLRCRVQPGHHLRADAVGRLRLEVPLGLPAGPGARRGRGRLRLQGHQPRRTHRHPPRTQRRPPG